MERVSIIVPVYNVEKYLKECLDSVINQTYKNIEIICVEDCSTDGSLEILENYAGRYDNIKIVKHSHNKGLSIARNTGLENCTGKYVFFLDSDDYVKTDIIQKMYDEIVTTKSDVVYSQTEVLSECNNNFIIDSGFKIPVVKNYRITDKNFMDFVNGVQCVAWGKLYSKEFLDKHNLRFINKKVAHEDNGFHLKLAAALPKISVVPDVGVVYRIRNNSIMTTKNKNLCNDSDKKDIQIILDDVFNYITANCKTPSKYIRCIKDSSSYRRNFRTVFNFLFKLVWYKSDKLIQILGIKIFTEKVKLDKWQVVKLFGIKISERCFSLVN